MNAVIQLRPSQSEKPTVRGGRAKNADYRQREYLTEAEIEKLLTAAVMWIVAVLSSMARVGGLLLPYPSEKIGLP